MGMLLLGLALLAMKAAAFGPVAEWSWFVVLAPFGLAVLWWAFADSTGLTQRRAIEKMEKRKIERRQRDMEALGLTTQRDKQVRRAQASVRREGPAPSSGTSSGSAGKTGATTTSASASSSGAGRQDPKL
jgi:small Trp-rich protein